MGKAWLWAAALVLAGCLQAPVQSVLPPPPTLPLPEILQFSEPQCKAYALAMLVDPVQTDPVLPPGFHLRDAAQFFALPSVEVETGLALVLVTTLDCIPGANQPTHQETAVSIFVRPPLVDGNWTAVPYEFYEVEHYSNTPSVQSRLGQWGWHVENVTLADRDLPSQANTTAFVVKVGGPDQALTDLIPTTVLPSVPPYTGSPALFSFGGSTPNAITQSDPVGADRGQATLRFWHKVPSGLAHLDYGLHLVLHFGAAACTILPGTTLYNLTQVETCSSPVRDLGAPGANAGQTRPVPAAVASFDTGFDATAVLQRGVHAQ